jgi:O-succinylhomoserine sulfhydrylase
MAGGAFGSQSCSPSRITVASPACVSDEAAIISFEVQGDTPQSQRENAYRLINAVEVMSVTGNLGDTRTTITHPATTTHGRISEEARQKAGIKQSLIRIAVGLEEIDDLKADLERGFSTQ